MRVTRSNIVTFLTSLLLGLSAISFVIGYSQIGVISLFLVALAILVLNVATRTDLWVVFIGVLTGAIAVLLVPELNLSRMDNTSLLLYVLVLTTLWRV